MIVLNILDLLQGKYKNLEIDEMYTFPEEMYQNSGILSLKDVSLKGDITYYDDANILLTGKVSGTMLLEDSISLEEVPYPFSFEIEENIREKIKKDENTLDILSILWENIVLEVPIRYTKVEDYQKYQGDGWSLVEEENYEGPKNNPFEDLL